MKVLILEDNPQRHIEFHKRMREASILDYEIVEDAGACIDRLQRNQYDKIFLDHDLGGQIYVLFTEENSGSGVVRWIVENKNNLQALFVIHSLNEGGRKNMLDILQSVGCECYEIPFVWIKDIFHKHITTK